MKFFFRTFLIIVVVVPYIVGCASLAQPTIVVIPLVRTTVTLHQPTPTATLPPIFTAIPLPVIATLILPTSTPIAKSIFDPFPKSFYRNTVKTVFGNISASEIIKEQILVDNTLGGIHFVLAWEEGNLDLALIQPDGTIVNESAIDEKGKVSFISHSNYREYLIDSPQPGTWTMVTSNKTASATNYKVEAYSTSCPMRVNVHIGNEDDLLPNIGYDKNYVSGDCIKLSASVEDIISLNHNLPIYIHHAAIWVTVNDPRKNRYSFELFDDGFHGDGKANDGIYANFFCNTKEIGEYFFYFQISGITNWNGGYGVGKLPFTREDIRSTVIHSNNIIKP